MPRPQSLIKVFREYIKNTPEKSIVYELTIYLCNLTTSVYKASNFNTHKIYITTKTIKHLYDSKPAEEFDFILKNIYNIVKYPDKIYKNKNGKRGQLSFVKEINSMLYFCSIETNKDIDPDNGLEGMNYIVTAFRLRKVDYLNGYDLLWSWKGGIPSS